MHACAAALETELTARGVPASAAALVARDVDARIAEALAAAPAERRLLFLTALEEAAHHEPYTAPLDVRALVVHAVRNSLLEDLASKEPFHAALQGEAESLSELDLRDVTISSARCFERLPEGAETPLEALRARFPRAARALAALAESSSAGTAVAIPGGAPAEPGVAAVVYSGLDPNVDATTMAALRGIAEKRLEAFFVDSFKMFSRNREKVWGVIDHVLAHGGTFLTHNYFIAPNYVARRERLLKPAGDAHETMRKFDETSGLTARHRKALAAVRAGLRSARAG